MLLLSIIHHCDCRCVDRRCRRHSNLRSSSIVILNFTVIHHSSLWLSMCRSTMSTNLRSWSICFPSSIIHHPSSILVTVEMSIDDVDDRWSMMLKSSPIVNTQFYCYPSWWMSICWSTIEDVKIVTDRDCRYMSIDDRRCRRPTMIDLKNRIRHGRFWDLSQCTGPKNKILARQKIFGTCPSGRLPKILARQITQSFACHLWPKIQISTSRKKI